MFLFDQLKNFNLSFPRPALPRPRPSSPALLPLPRRLPRFFPRASAPSPLPRFLPSFPSPTPRPSPPPPRCLPDARIVHALLAGRSAGQRHRSAQPGWKLSGGSGEGAGRSLGARDGRRRRTTETMPQRAKAPGGGGGTAKAGAAELKVFKSGSADGRVPGGPPASPAPARESLTNLSFLDSERRGYVTRVGDSSRNARARARAAPRPARLR